MFPRFKWPARVLPALAVGVGLLAGCRGPVPRPAPDPAASAFTNSADSASSAESSDSLPLSLQGCRYAGARALVEKYCADCHSSRGTSRSQESAYRSLRVDTYAEWIASSRMVAGRVDKDSLKGKIMPPPWFSAQPSDAERKLLAAWVKWGSPNTLNGE